MATETAEVHSLAAYGQNHGPATDWRPLRIAMFARHAQLFGAERALLRLAVGFGQRPHFQPLVAVPAEGSLSQRCRALGIPVLVSGHAPLGGTRNPHGSTTRRIARNLRVWPRLLRRLSRFGPDAIYTSTASVAIGAAIARQLDVAHVWHVQEMDRSGRPAGYGPAWPMTRRLMRTGHNTIVGNSEAVRESFARLLKSDSVTTVYEGFDFSPLSDLSAEDRYQARVVDPPVIELATAGALAAGKGQDDAIHAVADLVQRGHRVHLSIAGDGDADHTRYLHDLVRRHHLERCVTFHGFLADPGRLFEQSTITLICGRAEGFGRAAVESLCHGTPVIGTAGGGLPEILRPGRTGLLYPAGDSRALSDRIQALLRDRQLYAEIATAGAVWTRQHFPARRYVREMGELVTRAALAKQPGLGQVIDTGPVSLKAALVGEMP